jgi:adenylate cyclase class 2
VAIRRQAEATAEEYGGLDGEALVVSRVDLAARFAPASHNPQKPSKGYEAIMKHEYEAKFLAVDVTGLQAKLAALGAVQAFPRTLLTRKIFESDVLDGSQWVRLRNEGTRTTLTVKQVTDATSIHGTTEIETEVGDLQAMAEILGNLGLREVRYQENFREEWQLGDIAFDFDTWPDLPTFLEIEGPDEDAVRQSAARLGLDYADARFGSVDAIYKSEAGRDILAESTLLFSDVKRNEGLDTAESR